MLKPVTAIIPGHERIIWEVSLKGIDGETELFETTDEHPWWASGHGWKRTDELKAGMAIATADARGMVVASVVNTGKTDTTYNITVADFHTYFVGKYRVLVHNCGEVGSYTNLFSDLWGNITKYHGKGTRQRSQRSAAEVENRTGATHIATEWAPASNNRSAFKDEDKRIEADGGIKNPNNHNRRNSPGKKYREEDDR